MGKPIVVFGSFVMEVTAWANGLPVPGQTLLGKRYVVGGAGGKGSNQAVAAHRAGAQVTLVTKIGKDALGQVALDFYQKDGMSLDYVLMEETQETGLAVIMVDDASAQNAIVVIPGACMHFTDEDVQACRPLIENAAILLVQMEINFDALYKVIRIAHEAGVAVVLNPAPAAPLDPDALGMVDIVTPNETEAQALTGVAVHNQEDARQAAAVFLEKGVKQVVITLGSQGVFATDGRRDEFLPPLPVRAVDTTGAGDAFNGGFVTALSEGKDLFTALRYGNATGALSVTQPGAAPAMPARVQIDQMMKEYYGL